MTITIEKLSTGAIACKNESGAHVAWITPDGFGPVFDPLADTAEVFGLAEPVDYPALFAELGLNNLTIQQIANCRKPGTVEYPGIPPGEEKKKMTSLFDLDDFAPDGIYGPRIEPPIYTQEQVQLARDARAAELRAGGMTDPEIRALLYGEYPEVHP